MKLSALIKELGLYFLLQFFLQLKKKLLMKKMIAMLLCISTGYLSMAQTRQLTGLVTNVTNNSGVVSATVKVKNASNSTVTNADGRFAFNVPTGNIVLEISSVGFSGRDVNVSANHNDMNIQLT